MKLTLARETVLAGVAVLLIHALTRIWVAPGSFQDDAIYLALGKSLASGTGWHSIYAAGSPVHLKYPPALPAAYALFWTVGGSLERTLGLVHAFHLLVSGLCGALAWWTVRARLGGSLGAALIAITPFAMVSVVDHWQLSITEGPFVATWLGILALGLGPLTSRRALGLGLLLALATLLRTQGWALIGGTLLALVWIPERRRYAIPTAVAALAPVLVWSSIVALLARSGPLSTQPDEAGYLAPYLQMSFTEMLRAIAASASLNIVEYSRMLPRELGPPGPGHLLVAVGATAGVFGACRDWRRVAPLSLTVATSLGMLLILPFNQERYLLGVLPALALLVVYGWPVLARRLDARVGIAIVSGAMLMVLWRQQAIRRAATSPDPMTTMGFNPIGHVLTRNTAWLEAVGPWVASRTPPNARVFTEGAAGLWLATGRTGVAALPAVHTFMKQASEDPEGLAGRLVADSIDVVIASSPFVSASVVALERQCPGTFRRSENIEAIATAFAVSALTRDCLGRVIRGQ